VPVLVTSPLEVLFTLYYLLVTKIICPVSSTIKRASSIENPISYSYRGAKSAILLGNSIQSTTWPLFVKTRSASPSLVSIVVKHDSRQDLPTTAAISEG